MPKANKLTPKQARFVEEYLIDLNATQAAIRAGYSVKRASEIAYQLLQKTTVQEAIGKAQEERGARTEITADRVLEELAKLAFANMADYMSIDARGNPKIDFSTLSRDQAAALVEVITEEYMDGSGDDAREVKKVKFKLADKRAALVDVGKHLGMFNNRVELTGKDGGPVATIQTLAELVMASEDEKGKR